MLITLPLREYDLVYLSGAEWGGVRYRKQILCELLAQDFRRVLYYEKLPTRKLGWTDPARVVRRLLGRPSSKGALPDGVEIRSELLIPGHYPLAAWINKRTIANSIRNATLCGRTTVVITNTPGENAQQYIRALKPRVLVYDCDHDYEHCPWVPNRITVTEGALARTADCIVCDSAGLYRKWSAQHKHVVRLPPGVYQRHIGHPSAPQQKERYNLTYFGTVRNDTDTVLLNHLSRGGHNVHIFGSVSQKLRDPLDPQIRIRPCQTADELFERLLEMDALILPYRLNDYTRAICPAKLFEACATGKPILATPLPELLLYAGHIQLVETAEDCLRVIAQLPKLDSIEKSAERLQLAALNTWERRRLEMRDLLSSLLHGRTP